MVIFKIEGQRVTVGDPAAGVKEITIDDFSEIWTGHILSLKPEKQAVGKLRREEKASSFSSLSACKREMIVLAVSSVLASLVEVGTTYMTFYLIDFIFPKKIPQMVVSTALFTALLYLMLVFLHSVKAKIYARVINKANSKSISDFLFHVLKLPLDRFEQYTSGDYVSRIEDIDTVRETSVQVITVLLSDVVIFVTSMVLLFLLHKSLFFFSFIFIVLYAALIFSFHGALSKANNDYRSKDAQATTKIIELIKGFISVKAYNAEPQEGEKVSLTVKKLMNSLSKYLFILSEQDVLSNGFQQILSFFALSIGCYLAIQGSVTWGTIIACTTLLNIAFPSINNLVRLIPATGKAKIAKKRLSIIANEKTEEGGGKEASAENGYDLTLSELSFRYGNRALVLDDVSLRIKQGETVAIIGENGSGKSTLAKLLAKLYVRDSGSITLGNDDYDAISANNVRSIVSYVPQEIYLFSGSVEDNVLFGSASIGIDAVQKLKELHFAEIITEFGLDMNTILLEGGKNLSGGQKQLIGICRALVREPKILILDESTSSVDKIKERMVLDAILQASSAQTRIIISHEPHIVRKCERIILMQNGKIKATGTHEELMRSSSYYRDFMHREYE